jgi:hypothetical protein
MQMRGEGSFDEARIRECGGGGSAFKIVVGGCGRLFISIYENAHESDVVHAAQRFLSFWL